MATTITRTAMTDDSGGGTTGTIFNNAWLNASIYDAIDALFTGSMLWSVNSATASFAFTKTNTTVYTTADVPIATLTSGAAANDGVMLSFVSSGIVDNIGIKKGSNNFVIRVAVTGTPVDAITIDSTGLIQYGLGVIAMGGGAAPTFGTIGGSGPTAAAQAAWKKEKSSTGTVYYIPVWV